MKSDKLTVEIEEAKRFTKNAKSGVVVETFRASDTVRKADDGRVYNQYTGTIIVAEPADLTDCDNLAAKIKADLYADSDKSPAECLADVLNNGGLRLAYGDMIKSQYKIGGSTSVVKIKSQYMEYLGGLAAEGNVQPWKDFASLDDAGKAAAAVKWANERNAK